MRRLLAFSGLCLALALPLALAPIMGRSAVMSAPGAAPGLADATVLIVRHAEKPETGTDLTARGQARATAYAAYFGDLRIDGTAFRPDALIAAQDSPHSTRSRLTLAPLGDAIHLDVQQPFADSDTAGLASWLRSGRRGHSILIAWHHSEIPGLIAALGIDPGRLLTFGRWPADVYDRIVVLRFDGQGHAIPGDARVITEHIAV